MTAACPECAGPQVPEHPKGVLTIDHDRAACSLGNAEDSTTEADHRRASGWLGTFARPTTDAERTLLAAVGIDPDADVQPYTNVTPITPNVLRRHWNLKETT
jgi:hypothetical protein